MGKTVGELASETGSHIRTVYRDIKALETAGFPIYTEKRDNKSLWLLVDNAKSIPVPFTLSELMALYFGLSMLRILKNTVFFDSLSTLFNKIKSTIPKEFESYLQKLDGAISVKSGAHKKYDDFQDALGIINDAILAKKTIKMRYFTMSRNKESVREVDPFRLWFFDGAFYLIGKCGLRKDVRVFAVDRIKEITLTEKDFDIPDDFDADKFMKSGIGVFPGKPEMVKIRFSKEVASYITEKIWHDTQELVAEDDGSVLFTAELAVTEELFRWVMKWGAQAVVMEPIGLKEKVLLETRLMMEAYG